MDYLLNLSALELQRYVLQKKISLEEYLKILFDHIDTFETELNTFITLTPERAFGQARALQDKLRQGGNLGRLFGLPVAVKDNLCTRGVRTTCASKSLENFIPPCNATVMERIEAEDGILLGKTNMDEFAMGSSTEHSAFGPTRNPWDKECVPGGSSGGSAAALAGRLTSLALGSDTGGSIRQPAAFCSVVGLKPTYGRISRYGLVAFASSLDQVGPLARTVEDMARFLSVLAVHDPRDSTSLSVPTEDYEAELAKPLPRKLRIGLPREYFSDSVHPEILLRIQEQARLLEKQGMTLVEISLPHTDYAIAVYYLIATSEASSNLARYEGIHYGFRHPESADLKDVYMRSRSASFGDEVKRRIFLGTFALSAGYTDEFYRKALKVRRLIAQDFEKAFQSVDVILGPTSPLLPFKLGEKVKDPLRLYLCDVLTVSCNLAGFPGISLPAGLSQNGLPIGLQLLAPPLHEALLLQLGALLERETSFHKLVPDLTAKAVSLVYTKDH